jgi:hypothetical protein
MAEYKVTINATPSKAKAISVSPKNVQNTIIATPDTSLYFSNLSRQWAVGEGLIQGEGYSSKHYANLANESATISQANAEASKNIYNQFQESLEGSLNNVDNAVQEAITTIDTKSNEAIDSINNTKTTILSDIEFVADGEKKEIQELADNAKDDIKSTGFYMRDDKLYFINSNGEEEEFKSGGGGLEIGDIGIAPLGIDETKGKRRYLNGQVIVQDQYVTFTSKVKQAQTLYPNLFTTEENWQAEATLSAFGACGKFVIDDDANTIRLPKITGFIQGLTDLASLGDLVEAGLPNITAETSLYQFTNATLKGAFYLKERNGTGGPNTNGEHNVVGFDASRSNPIYGNSNTVQPEAIQYPYFIQVATGAETEADITKELELNIPFFFGMSQYFNVEPNNVSWLKSNGQWNSKAVYTDYYDWILSNVNGGVEGFVLSTDTYTDYDFVINTADETFRLPLLDGSESLVGSRYIEYTRQQSGALYTAPANGFIYYCGDGNSAGNSYVEFVNTTNRYLGMATQLVFNGTARIFAPARRGDVFELFYNGTTPREFRFLYAEGNGSLYFYVGETIQNANLINAGRIEEKLVDKVDTNAGNLTAEGKSLISGYAMPSDKYIDLTLGASGTNYTAPANGWLFLQKVASASGQYIQMHNITSHFVVFSNSSGTYGQAIIVPCKKGDVIQTSYTTAGNTLAFRFIYAEGEV